MFPYSRKTNKKVVLLTGVNIYVGRCIITISVDTNIDAVYALFIDQTKHRLQLYFRIYFSIYFYL